MRGKVHNFDVVNDFTCSLLLSDLNTSRSDSAIVLSKTERCDKNYCALRLSTLRLFFRKMVKCILVVSTLHGKKLCAKATAFSPYSLPLFISMYISLSFSVYPPISFFP